MASRSRSNNGCWTCRLRKKKCDEKEPGCAVCRSLCLICYGYGPRPEWMDGGARERKIASEIRNRVKQETSRKQKLRMRTKNQIDRLPYRKEDNIKHAGLPNNLQARLNHRINQGTWNSARSLAPAGSPSFSNTSENTRITLEEEEGLLMHYLDYVFPLQFRFYRPSPFDGGRGWLLSIILRTKPLYYAAITLSAFHRQLINCTASGSIHTQCDMDGLLSRYADAIKELRLFIEGFGTSNLPKTLPELVEILACTVILISLELFNGNSTDNWQVHLKAATSLIPLLQTDSMACTYPELTPVYKSALYFFGGVLAWYDILSFATTRARATTLYPCLGPGSGYRGYIQLEKLMGCENWVMLNILDIAILNDRKKTIVNERKLALDEHEAQRAAIERRLEECLRKNAPKEHESEDVKIVTNIFACSALIYLHVVVSGANPELDNIRSAVGRTINAFRKLPDPELFRYLIWPICITACMATEEYHDFFTKMAIPEFGMSLRAMEMIQECWRLRKSRTSETDLIDWNTAMQSLGIHVLLA